MNAVVPLNVAALRVSENDSTNVVGEFKGRVADFDSIPYQSTDKRASTGDTVVQPLQSTSSPLNPLGPGVHVHWELPDFFRRGVQPVGAEQVTFPQVPNRWLVTRWLSVWDAAAKSWGAATAKSWVVESDYVSPTLQKDPDGTLRPAAPVPLEVTPGQPFAYMGRVVDAEGWSPSSEPASSYLPAYLGEDGKPAYLTANGFVGPGFSSYYPDCCSVFGFWDRFLDRKDVFTAIKSNQPLQFRASYQVTGWIDTGAPDPLDGFADVVKQAYDQHVAEAAQQGVAVDTTPADAFGQLAEQQFRWSFHTDDVGYTLNPDGTLATLDAPQKTLCAGTLQEVVWDMLDSPGTSYFLNNPDDPQHPGVWTDTVELAVGNTPVEALSALIKHDLDAADPETDPDVLTNYEYLLDALQLGLLKEVESQPNKLILLEESLHSGGFARQQGGVLWIVQPTPTADTTQPPVPDEEVTLPLDLAESLSLLNDAQKAYDMARDGLETMRRQLFMDWFRYVKMYAGGVVDPNVSLNTLTSFLGTSGTGELAQVVAAGAAAGVLEYVRDPVSGAVTGLVEPTGSAAGSAAYAVWNRLDTFEKALAAYPQWGALGVPAPPFWQPTDPTVLMEGDRIEPVRRNGIGPDVAVRLSGETVGTLGVDSSGTTFSVNASAVDAKPAVSASVPYADDVQALLGEAVLLTPSLAPAVAAALAAEGGSGNPAAADAGAFTASLNAAQGGLSPLEGGPGSGLFAAVRADGYVPAANPTRTVTAPQALTFTFTNAADDAWPPDPVAWSAQRAWPEFTADRYDPFLPVSLVWSLGLDPLRHTGPGGGYGATTVTDFFQLDDDAVDYRPLLKDGRPASFTTGTTVRYDGSVALSKKPTFSLTRQIDSYVSSNPNDPADPTLQQISAYYQTAKMMAQATSGFGGAQSLRTPIAQITVEDLTRGGRDAVTTQIAAAAIADSDDNWYDIAFNAHAPIATGLIAQHNFGPLRAGFLSVYALEIVDVWGQRMVLSTEELNADGSLRITAAVTLQPLLEDTANAGKAFLPPRVNWPARLWFRWLSAVHDAKVDGVSADFVEMNTHPGTSPVCGWIVPNHLDDSLLFYDADGSPIGSFGVEHDDLRYRTRAGNTANPSDSLEADIGPPGEPTVNAHTADVMWHVHAQDAAFLADLMAAILGSDGFIDPSASAQEPSLAVLMGRPLAIVRAVLGMESAGNVLPLSQADTAATDPWPQDVNAGRTAYADRMAHSTAALGGVHFPVRMGDLANVDDGLVGFFLETGVTGGTDPYGTFYSPAAPAGGTHGVTAPNARTVQVTLNAQPLRLTMFVDPRAGVHATTGVLPVEELDIPSDQYAEALHALQVTFVTLPVLNERQGLVLPLPAESGYAWAWVSPGASSDVPLAANASDGGAVWDYTPQKLLEGWLRLKPDPTKSS